MERELSDTKAELNNAKTTRVQVERDLRTQLGQEQVLRKQQLDEFGTFVKDLKTQLSQERELRKQQELRIQDTKNEKMQLQQALRDEQNRRQFDGDEADETQGRLEAELENSKTLINELVKKSRRSFQRYCIFVATMERNLKVYQDSARGAVMDDRDSDDTKMLQKEIKNIHCFLVFMILYVALGLGAVVTVSLYRNRSTVGLTDGSTVRATSWTRW